MYTLFYSEWLKLKRTKIIWMATILPLFAIFQGWTFANGQKGPNVFEEFLITGSLSFYCWLALPLLITVVIAMMARIEHSNNGWKQLLAMPISKGQVYGVKLGIALLLIFYSMMVLLVVMILAAINLGIDYSLIWILKKTFLIYVASLPMIGVIFYISYRFQHVAIPLAVGAGLSLPSMFVANSEKYWIFYPWDYPIMSSLSHMFSMGDKASIMYAICLVTFIFCLLIGFLQFKSKDIL
ncbi:MULTISPECIES: ABC transporter permease [unclassified Bacillus (in: firmicutes)]|uniref:ABC transporter permease n=1 Tax=unclassified Bacillus (in: firmicutes) TaxID=185979 RepID=UPI0008E8D303|nr:MULTISPECIES: ABC transporter permease [unclassified Bacillus (in: firmicutes)]SFB06505.1 hypothetical protein SAMN02799634_10522 [Bacillus sp. UNCCL13]SFQ87656.1 hypothetical protein SAMN04488577_3096 [Bacillus sp. cl95]